MRFALVGKMDVNRDGKDDRAELKRMIQEAGGIVDLRPAPADLGKETGTLSPRIDWYVIDDRIPFAIPLVKRPEVEDRSEQAKLEKRVGEVDQGGPAQRHPADDDRAAPRLTSAMTCNTPSSVAPRRSTRSAHPTLDRPPAADEQPKPPPEPSRTKADEAPSRGNEGRANADEPKEQGRRTRNAK